MYKMKHEQHVTRPLHKNKLKQWKIEYPNLPPHIGQANKDTEEV